jgi:hemolysin activation/secretion protein
MKNSICTIGKRTLHLLLFLTLMPVAAAASEDTATTAPTFAIREFLLEGNSIFHDDRLMKTVQPFMGENKTSKEVEQARAAVETYYHQAGYPTVLVNIPEQTVDSGVVRLEVIESKIRRVRVTGNRYFTREGLLREMPAFRPGEILYLPRVKEQLARVNRNPDLKVAPILTPGKKLGTIDVEFRVKDKLPLHGELEYNNRSTHTTTDTRLNGMLRYDNLWQKEHAIVLQYQTSPEDTDEVKLLIGSYGLPSPLDPDHLATFYGVWSDSETAAAGDITVVGKGHMIGLRYLIPLPSFESYIHDLTVGLDYKDFDDVVGEDIVTPVEYLPLSAVYTAAIPDDYGQTGFSLGLDFNLRQAGSGVEEFEAKRSGSSGNYLRFIVDLERDQKLVWGSRLWLQTDAQWADQALISNEQYIAGGIYSVRGYKENEAAGDIAWHGTAELRLPDLGQATGIGRWFECTPYFFYDAAVLRVIDPLPEEDEEVTLSGAGVGVRGYLLKMFEYELDWAKALEETENTEEDEYRVHFIVKFKF